MNLGFLDGLGTQVGGILTDAIDAVGQGGINRLTDTPRPVDETPVASDAVGADNRVIVDPMAYINTLPLYVKVGAGVVALALIYKIVK